MLTIKEFIWVIKSYNKFNKGKLLRRCVLCNTLDWWDKNVKPKCRICYYCFIDIDRE